VGKVMSDCCIYDDDDTISCNYEKRFYILKKLHKLCHLPFRSCSNKMHLDGVNPTSSPPSRLGLRD
jgi:hypothetical protein